MAVSWRRLILFVAALMLAPALAAAQDCPAPSTDTFQGSLWWGESTTFAVNLLPCQTVSFAIATSAHPYGAVLDFKLFTANNDELLSEGWLSYGSANHSVPSTPLWVTPYRGTRGSEGLPVTARLHASPMGWQVYSYTIVMTKLPRPGYNQGGTSFSNAPLIATGVNQYGSIHENEPGQFYKIHLESGQSVFLAGEAMGSPQYGSAFSISLYDANQQWINLMVNVAPYGTVPLTPQGVNPTVFTNTGGPADFYLKVLTQAWPTHDFHFAVLGTDTLVFDGFAGSNNTTINGRTPVITQNGNTWSVTGTPGAVLFGNQAGVSGQQQASGETRMLVDAKTSDAVFAMDWSTPPAGTTPYVPLGGLIFRATDSANYWMASYGFSAAALELWQVRGGAWTRVGLSDGFAITAGTTHHMEVQASGTSIGLWWDGVLRVTARDGFNASATRAGIYFYPPEDWISRFGNFLVKGALQCATGLGPSPINANATAGNVSASITAPSGCAWQIDTDAAWLAPPSPATGTGSSVVSFSASENNTGITRSGTITAGGQSVVVIQPPTVPSSPSNILIAGQALTTLVSPNGSIRLVYQTDGNIVLTQGTQVLWSSHTSGSSVGTATMQADGDFVIRDATGTIIWATYTGGHPGASLVVQDDGDLAIYAPNQTKLWETGTTGGIPSGGNCTFSISTNSVTLVPPIPRKGRIGVFTQPGCTWSATSDSAWLHLSSAQGSGYGAVFFEAEQLLTGTSERAAVVTIASQTLVVNQVFTTGGVSASGDADYDGIPDATESALATNLMPVVWMPSSGGNTCNGPLNPKPIVYRVRPLVFHDTVYYDYVAIHYVLLYDQDCGPYGGFWGLYTSSGLAYLFASSHPGDAEPFAVFAYRDPNQGWTRHSASARAHGHTVGDIQSWGNGAAIWVSESKHSNYASLAWCNSSGIDGGNCDNGYQLQNDPLVFIPAGEPGFPVANNLGDYYPPYAGNLIWTADGVLGGPAVIQDGLFTTEFTNLMSPPGAVEAANLAFELCVANTQAPTIDHPDDPDPYEACRPLARPASWDPVH